MLPSGSAKYARRSPPRFVDRRPELAGAELTQARTRRVHLVDIEAELECSRTRPDRVPVHVLAVGGADSDPERLEAEKDEGRRAVGRPAECRLEPEAFAIERLRPRDVLDVEDWEGVAGFHGVAETISFTR